MLPVYVLLTMILCATSKGESHCEYARPISWKLGGLQGIASVDWSDNCVSSNNLCHIAGWLHIK